METTVIQDLQEAEVFNLAVENGKLYAYLSYKLPNADEFPNSGYRCVRIPVNIRDIQYSVRGNMLVNQSVKTDVNSIPAKTTTHE